MVLQSNVSINLVQKQGSKITNLTSFDKNQLNNNIDLQETLDITIDSDGNIILQVKIRDKQYETIIIPYVTQGNSVYSIQDLKIIEKGNDLFVVGEYDTLLEDNSKINSRLEKVVVNEKES